MPIPPTTSVSNISARPSETHDAGPTPIEPSLVACLTMLSLARHDIVCERSAVQVRADENGRHHVEIALPFGAAGDSLHDGARVAKGVSDDLALVQRPGSGVRVAFS